MKKISIFAIVLVFILALSSITVLAAAGNDVKVNITMGVGEKRPVGNYTKPDSQVIWTSQNLAVASVVGSDIVARSVGTTIINGKSGTDKYTIIVKVLENATDAVVSTATPANNGAVVKSDGSTINFTEIPINIGINDRVDVTGLLPQPYYNYLWRVNLPKTLTCSKGIVKGVKEGIAKVTAAGNSASTKNNIIRINVTIDGNTMAKNLKLRKQTKVNLNPYIGDAENFAITVPASQGTAVSVADGMIVTPNATGTSVVFAESLTGGKNYTLIVKVI